jgi:hypothetical protein
MPIFESLARQNLIRRRSGGRQRHREQEHARLRRHMFPIANSTIGAEYPQPLGHQATASIATVNLCPNNALGPIGNDRCLPSHMTITFGQDHEADI